MRVLQFPLAVLILSAVSLPTSAATDGPSIDEAVALQRQGKLTEARDVFRAAAANYQTSGDTDKAIVALSTAGKISISIGDYSRAIDDVEQAIKLRQSSHILDTIGDDYNTLGRAYQYLGKYSAALEEYEEALKIDRAGQDATGEVTRLNNIGNIYYFEGSYSIALAHYLEALRRVDATGSERLIQWGQQLTNANIATVYQRLGLEERALEYYKDTSNRADALPPNEYAQLLLNEGVLYRRMGDPVKALELYRKAQGLFRLDRQADGEIGAFRNIGIVDAWDLEDLPGALKAFSESVALSKQSSNKRGLVQASLYRGEVLRRLGRIEEARADLSAALSIAQEMGLLEEQWKGLFALGQTEENVGNQEKALKNYQQSIAAIEAIRATLRVPSLKSDFLADKRDVYDAVISAQMQVQQPPVGEIFRWIERSRARTLLDRVAARMPVREFSLQEVQSRLPADSALVEFWIGNRSSLAVWMTQTESGVISCGISDDVRTAATKLLTALQSKNERWRESARTLGNILLRGIPLRAHVIVVPDGPLNIPFEILGVPDSDQLLIERSDVSFLPAASFVPTAKSSPRKWGVPWKVQLMAFGNPPVYSSDALAEKEKWQPLPASIEEVRQIASAVPGKAQTFLGADARKSKLVNRREPSAPLLHFSTHATVDAENPDRSRILLSSDRPNDPAYLFQEEVYDLDLKNTDLVTVSACDTARGKMVRGEGIQAFSQAFLAAGASATVTSLWRVEDRPTEAFMARFYLNLGRGMPKSEALRTAKLEFLHSKSGLAEPRYWAAFVIHGDGWNPIRRVFSWSELIFLVAALTAILAAVSLYIRYRHTSRLRR